MTRKPAKSPTGSGKWRVRDRRDFVGALATRKPRPPSTTDPDDAPAWTDEQLDRAELAEGGKVLRPAQGTLTRPRGRPRLDSPKRQVSVRLDPEVLDALRASGPGWQGRMNDVLRKAFGVDSSNEKGNG